MTISPERAADILADMLALVSIALFRGLLILGAGIGSGSI
jgi:hypothetical protein